MPLQTEFIELQFTAPANQQIGNLQAKCPIRFKVNYQFTATTTVDVSVINYDELQRLLRAGQSPAFAPVQNVGRGPIKILFDFGATLPIRTSSSVAGGFKSILPVFITVEDKGTGLLDKIPVGALKLSPPETGFIPTADCDRFTKSSIPYTNSEEIPFIRKKTVQLRCPFKVPSDTEVPIQRSYFFSSEFTYPYDINQEVEVTVNPIAV